LRGFASSVSSAHERLYSFDCMLFNCSAHVDLCGAIRVRICRPPQHRCWCRFVGLDRPYVDFPINIHRFAAFGCLRSPCEGTGLGNFHIQPGQAFAFLKDSHLQILGLIVSASMPRYVKPTSTCCPVAPFPFGVQNTTRRTPFHLARATRVFLRTMSQSAEA